jgi:hypothetical protein
MMEQGYDSGCPGGTKEGEVHPQGNLRERKITSIVRELVTSEEFVVSEGLGEE